MEKNEPQTMDLEAPDNIRKRKLVNNDMKKNLLETDITVESLIRCPKVAAGLTENISEVNIGTKKVQRKIKMKTKLQDELQNACQAKMDTGSTENLAEKNVNGKRKRRERKKKAKNKVETQSIDQVDGMLNLHISDGAHEEVTDGKQTEKACTFQESGISVRKESSLSGVMHKKENTTLDSCKDEEAEVSVRKESSILNQSLDKENPLDLCKETVLLPDVVEVSSNRLASEVVEERSEHVLRPFEVDGIIPSETQVSTYHNQVAAVNPKPKNELNEVKNEISVYKGRFSAERSSTSSTCDIEVTQHPCSSDVNEAEWLSKDIGQYPIIPLIPSIKRKLIVLDVNGLLASIIMPAPKDCKADIHLLGRAIFKRPFCDEFLKFCFQNFDVGVWSSRSKKIIDRVVEYLFGDLNDKLLFCWDMSHSTQTGFRTVENIHKPLVFKELRKIWENDDPNLTWKNGDYNESNTLLLDDSPYKALLNPLHTAIFPNSYHYKDENDNSLGPGGDLRVYLEGLLTSENFRGYVEQHPFGQGAINETNLCWGFYSEVLQAMSNRLENNTSSSLPNLS